MFPPQGQWAMGQMPQAMPQPEAVEAPQDAEETDNSHRPPNAFILYSQAMRTQVRQENPSLSNTEVSRLLGKMWKEVPNEIKLQYKQKAAAMQEEFKREHPDYTYRKARRKRALNELLTKSSSTFPGFPMGAQGFPMPPGDMQNQFSALGNPQFQQMGAPGAFQPPAGDSATAQNNGMFGLNMGMQSMQLPGMTQPIGGMPQLGMQSQMYPGMNFQQQKQ